MSGLLTSAARVIDILGAPATLLSSLWLTNVRKALHVQPISRRIFSRLGVMPVRHHYYEPIVFPGDLRQPLGMDRTISGLDLNVAEQLDLLKQFDFNQELTALPLQGQEPTSFYYENGLFETGDAEFMFNMIRHFKPSNIIEIGGGFSTLLTRSAIEKNTKHDKSYRCAHTCIEPYEAPWLEKTGANIVRKKVELMDLEFFQSLGANDILFIDSSHVIRPQGDVLFEFLELIGSLRSGVLVHIHDVYTPKDYPEKWVFTCAKLWNEQYLLEAFLSHNNDFRVLGSLNHLWHNHRDALKRVCPMLDDEPRVDPTSFWIVRN